MSCCPSFLSHSCYQSNRPCCHFCSTSLLLSRPSLSDPLIVSATTHLLPAAAPYTIVRPFLCPRAHMSAAHVCGLPPHLIQLGRLPLLCHLCGPRLLSTSAAHVYGPRLRPTFAAHSPTFTTVSTSGPSAVSIAHVCRPCPLPTAQPLLLCRPRAQVPSLLSTSAIYVCCPRLLPGMTTSSTRPTCSLCCPRLPSSAGSAALICVRGCCRLCFPRLPSMSAAHCPTCLLLFQHNAHMTPLLSTSAIYVCCPRLLPGMSTSSTRPT
jgi:hypothetical protein